MTAHIEIQAQIAAVADRLGKFRRERRYVRQPIPEDIWQSIIELGQQAAPIAISKALKIDLGNLRRHLRQPSQSLTKLPNPSPAVPASQFVRIAPVVFAGGSTTGGYTVEIQNREGAQLRACALTDAALDSVVARFLDVGGSR